MAAPKKNATKPAKPRLTPDAIMQLGLGFWLKDLLERN